MSLPVGRIFSTDTAAKKTEHIQTIMFNTKYHPEFSRSNMGHVIIQPPGSSISLSHPRQSSTIPLLTRSEASLLLYNFFRREPEHETFNKWYISHYQGPAMPRELKGMIQDFWRLNMVNRLDCDDKIMADYSYANRINALDYAAYFSWPKYERYNIKFQGRIAFEEHDSSTKVSKINNVLDIFESREGNTFILKISRQRRLKLVDLAAEQIAKDLESKQELDALCESSPMPHACKEAIMKHI